MWQKPAAVAGSPMLIICPFCATSDDLKPASAERDSRLLRVCDALAEAH